MTDPTTSRYSGICAEADRNSCVPVAIALTTGLPYAVVNRECLKQGRRPGCGMHEPDWRRAIEALGFELIQHPVSSKTVRTLDRELARTTDGNIGFLVLVRRHMLAFHDGRIQDWTSGRLHKVKRVYRIVPKGDTAPLPTPAPAPFPRVPAPKKPRGPRNGDAVAQLLNGKELDWVYRVVSELIADGWENAEPDLRERYKHLNPGQQRMCLGNKLRAAWKKGQLEQNAYLYAYEA